MGETYFDLYVVLPPDVTAVHLLEVLHDARMTVLRIDATVDGEPGTHVATVESTVGARLALHLAGITVLESRVSRLVALPGDAEEAESLAVIS